MRRRRQPIKYAVAHSQSKSFKRQHGVLIRLMKAKAFTHKNVGEDGTFTDGNPGAVKVNPDVIVNRGELWAMVTTGRRDDGTVKGITMFFDSLEEMEELLR